MSNEILVLGATGASGGEVARQLIAAGHRPRLLVRANSRAKLAEFEGKATIVEGDLLDEVAFAAALDGIDKLYLVSAELNGRTLETNLIDAAKDAGVSHIVKLSVLTAEDPKVPLAKWHAAAERHLMDSGIAWTMIRPGHFHSNAIRMWADSIKAQGVFFQPTGDGKWASVDPIDIGAMAVAALTTAGHAGKAYSLTGPESTNAAGYAAIISSVLGRPVSFVDAPPEMMEQAMRGFGFPEIFIAAALELFAAVKADDWNFVAPDIENILGRKAIGFEDWMRRNVSHFA